MACCFLLFEGPRILYRMLKWVVREDDNLDPSRSGSAEVDRGLGG